MQAPDVLLASASGTFALFTPSSAERRSASDFGARFILARLALPPYTRSLLVAEDQDLDIAKKYGNDFAEVIPWASRRDVLRIVTDPKFVGRHRDVPQDILGQAQWRYANVMKVTRSAERRHRASEEISSPFVEEFKTAPHRSRKKVSIQRDTPESMLGVSLALADDELDSKNIINLINTQADHLYILDTGVPYRRSSPPGIALVHSLPRRKRDPDKLLHAAAFGGWALVREEQSASLQLFSEQLAKE